MKKIIFVLCAMLALFVQASATDFEDVSVAYGDAMIKSVESSSSTQYQGLFSESWGLSASSSQSDNTTKSFKIYVPISVVGSDSFLFCIDYTEEFYNKASYIEATDFFDSMTIYRGRDYDTIDITSDMVSSDGVTAYFSLSNTLSSTSGYVRQIAITFLCDDPSVTSITFNIKSHTLHSLSTNPITIINFTDSTLDDVVASIEALRISNDASNSAMASAVASAVDDMRGSLEGELMNISDNILSTNQQIVDKIEESIENAAAAEDKFYKELKEEAGEIFDSAVDDISSEIPVDLSALQSSFDNLYNGITNHSTNTNITFPAGTLTLMGETYTFWDEVNFNLDDIFNQPMIKLILIPVRFLFVFGMAKYLISYFEKIIKLVTLHTGGE